MIRITSDIDSKNKLKIIYYFTKSLFIVNKIKKIEVLRSHSNNYHIIIWTNKNYTIKEQFKLREKLGDDKHRLNMDKLRKFGRNTLFYKKEKYLYPLPFNK